MTTEADIGHGTLFQTGDDASPEVWTTLAEVVNITPPNMVRDSIDASHGQSPDNAREFIPGMVDGGEVPLELNFVPGGTAYAALTAELALARSAATKNRRILWTDGSFLEFRAFLTNCEPDSPLDDVMRATATFKVTGRPVLTQAA